MKTRLLILIPIIVGFSVSIPLIISNTSGGTYYTQDIDPRFSEVTKGGFEISSNLDIYSISVEDEINGLSIGTSKNPDGFINMDDPLPILQKLYPEKNIDSFVVLSRGTEIPYTVEGGKLEMSISNPSGILIKGIFQDKVEPLYNPYETRCSFGGIPFIPEEWQSLGLHPSDSEWESLGRHLIREEFYNHLKQQDIIFTPACFGIHTGPVDESYPPRFSMCTVVEDLDGSKIYLEGTAHEFEVIYFEMNDKIPYICNESHHGCLCKIEKEN